MPEGANPTQGPDKSSGVGAPSTPSPAGLSRLLQSTEADKAQVAAREAARQDDAHRFQAKHGCSLEEVEQAAERGDLAALCQLIAWDKSWLFTELTMRAVFRAESAGDQDTLREIAKALPRLDSQLLAGQRRRSPRGTLVPQTRLLELEMMAVRDPTVRDLLRDPKFLQTFLQILTDNDLISGEIEPTYFRTLLKRKGLIS